jgi:peptide/nickel transport system substrate-binding protein
VQTRARWTVLALIVVVTMMASACGATPAPQVVEVEKEVTRIVEGTPIVETIVETQVVKEEVIVEVTPTPPPIPEGGYVTEVGFSDAKILNPILSTDDASSDIHDMLFGAALRQDPVSGEVIPDMTDGWEVSDDGLTYTFKVHEGIFWTDGTQVTAKDFAFTYQALMSGNLDTPRLSNVEYVKEINVIDEMTVEFVFSEVNCAALFDMGLGWLPAHMYAADFSDIMTNTLNTEPTVTNGPMILQEWVKDDHITLVRNPNYWRGAPHLEGYVYKVVPNATVGVQQLKTGEVDIYDAVDPKYLVEMELEPHLNIFKYFDDGYTFIGFQMGDPNNPQPLINEDGSLNEDHGIHPILGDVRVRYAITYSVDRNIIISKVIFGQGAPMNANVLPAITWAFNDQLQPREYDLDKAAALLEEAGWTDQDGDGVRECHGCLYAEEGAPLKLKLITNAGNETRESVGLIVQDQLGQIGFDIEFEPMEWNAYVGVLVGQNFDMCIVGWTDNGSDPDDEGLFGTAADQPGGGFNFVSYNNPDVNDLLKQAKTIPGCKVEDRGPLYRTIQEKIYEDAPYTFLFVPRSILVYNKRIGGMELGAWDFRYSIYNWYIQP